MPTAGRCPCSLDLGRTSVCSELEGLLAVLGHPHEHFSRPQHQQEGQGPRAAVGQGREKHCCSIKGKPRPTDRPREGERKLLGKGP